MELFKIFGTVAIRNAEANNALDETTDKAEGSQNKIVSAFKKIGAAVATYFAVDKITGFGKEVVNLAAEVSAEASAFEQIMGDYAGAASEKVNKIADATGMVRGFAVPDYASLATQEDDKMVRWNKLEDMPEGYRKMAERYVEAGALRGKANGDLDLSEDMLRAMEIMRRYFEEE